MTRYRIRRQAMPAPARYSLTWQVIRDVLLAGIVGTALVYAFLLILTAAS